MNRRRLPRALPGCLLGALVLGCGSSDDSSSDSALTSGPAPAGASATVPGNGSLVPAAGQPIDPNSGMPTPTSTPGEPGGVVDVEGNPVEPVPILEAEEEVLVPFELPAAGDRYVYAAIPENNSVVVIDADTLNIQSIEAGQRPTFLQTLPDTDTALVLNVGSEDATLVRTQDGDSATQTVEVVSGANALAMSPDGTTAIVFYDARRASSEGLGSFQDISVLDLRAGNESSVAMTVGFRPSDVAFSEDGGTAFVVTEDGVSILDLEEVRARGPFVAETASLGSDAKALDVSVTPDGSYALARHSDESVLRLLNLSTRERSTLNLAQFFVADDADDAETAPDAGAAPEPAATEAPLQFASITDVDLAPSGEFAIAVVRDRRSVLRVPIPGGFADASTIETVALPTEIVGSVAIAPNGARALLYTTAQDENERVSIYDVDANTTETIQLPKAVLGVTIAGDGTTALIIHQKLPGNPNEVSIDPDTLIDRSYGYSVLDLDSGFSKLQVTPVAPGPTAIVPDSSHVFVLFPDPSLREVHRVGLESFLVERTTLGSTPISVGVVPRARKVFVTQDHPDGRITFIDWETAETETVTGFELNSRIRE